MIRGFVTTHEKGWQVKFGGPAAFQQPLFNLGGAQPEVDFFRIKLFAIMFAVRRAKQIHADGGQTVSLLIQKTNGRWQEERTYGPDPTGTPG